jgi:hypothetical protein
MSTTGATGKDTSNFVNDISRFNTVDESSGTHTSTTMDEVLNCFCKNAGMAACNKDRDDRRDADYNAELSENEELIGEENVENPIKDDLGQVGGEDDDEFSALQHLSKANFKKVINFSLKSTTEATTQSTTSSAPITSQKTSTPFNQHAIVFRVADEILGDEIPR